MRKIYLLACLICSGFFVHAQMTPAWARTAGGTGDDQGTAIAVDHHGGVYVAGTFASTNFIIGGTPLTRAGGTDIFVAKYDTAGALLWAKRFGGTSDESVSRIAVSTDGSIYFTGASSSAFSIGSTNFGGGVYLAKLDANGNLVWAKQVGLGSLPTVQTDSRGSIYIAYFNTSNGYGLTKYDTSGSMRFTKTIANGYEKPAELSVDRLDNIHISYFGSTTYSNRNWYDSTGVLLGSSNFSGNARYYVTGYKARYPDEYYYAAEYVTLGGAADIYIGGSITSNSPYHGCAAYSLNTDIDNLDHQFSVGNTTYSNSCAYAGLDQVITADHATTSAPITIHGYNGEDIFFTERNASGVIDLGTTKDNGKTNEWASRMAVDTGGHAVYAIGYWSKIADTSKFRFNGSMLTNTGAINTNDMLLIKLGYDPGMTPLHANAGIDLRLCHGGTEHLSASTSGGDGHYQFSWSPAAGLSSTTIANPAAHPDTTTSYILTVTDNSGHTASDTVEVMIDSSLYKPQITLMMGTNPFCDGQTTAITSSPAVSYHWSNGSTTQNIEVHHTDTFTVTAINADGCIGTSDPYIITMNPRTAKPTISPAGPLALCGSATVTVTASDNETPVTYAWSTGATTPGITISSAGTYTVTATNATGCTSLPATISITSAAAPTATIIASSDTVFCAGDSVKLTVHTEAVNTVLWNDGLTTKDRWVKTSGTYTATVTSPGGCVAPAQNSIHVTVIARPPAPTITPGGTVTICAGGHATLTASDAQSGVGYIWSTSATTSSITVDGAHTYSVHAVGEHGCSSEGTSVTVVVAALPVPVITQSGNTLSVSPAAAHYQWYLNGSAISGATAQTLHITAGGNYSVHVTTEHGCEGSASFGAVLRLASGNITYQVFPNPSSGEIHINYSLQSDARVTINLNDINGQRVIQLVSNQQQQAGDHQYTINNSSLRLQPGYYVLVIEAGGARTEQRIIVL